MAAMRLSFDFSRPIKVLIICFFTCLIVVALRAIGWVECKPVLSFLHLLVRHIYLHTFLLGCLNILSLIPLSCDLPERVSVLRCVSSAPFRRLIAIFTYPHWSLWLPLRRPRISLPSGGSRGGRVGRSTRSINCVNFWNATRPKAENGRQQE